MNRRSFVRWSAGLLPSSLTSNLSCNRSRTRKAWPTEAESGIEGGSAIHYRGIIALYDDPKQKPSGASRFDGSFWDRAKWEEYLSLWSHEGYNVVFWLVSAPV